MKYIIILNLLTLIFGLNSCDESKEKIGFYESISGWDVRHVPIIPPFKATSADGGRSWLITGKDVRMDANRGGHIPILEFGVCKNYIYGSTPKGHTNVVENWFLFNTTTLLYVEYSTKNELIHTLKKYKLDFNPMLDCKEYFKELTNNKRCYWFPPKGESYPLYQDFRPDSSIVINIEDGNIDIQTKIKKAESKIYYFRIKFNKEKNDHLYISVNSSSPQLLKDNLEFSSVVSSNFLEVFIYTPFPVAEEKGIKEKDRIVIKKIFWF
ncbi:MAG: hypothetical protein K2X86_00810 [Cytophagaceae bacterium]|nr:hypothetical protein [Cytophagaceae bacterium]